MKIFQKAVLHPKLENESREEVKEWCKLNFSKDTWYMNSNYTPHGCFNITVTGRKNESAVTAFILKFPEVITISINYDIFATIDEEAFNRNFEFV